jgi:phosphatidylglycerol:prolipoprotein diacylglycerol transferase
VWIAVSLCYLVGMTAGAKVLFDIRHAQFSLRALMEAKHWLQGGLWGGLLAYFAAAVPMSLLFAKRRAAALDLTAVSVPLPWMMAKLGCLLNGCCYGRPCNLPWAITFGQGAAGAPAGIPLHPTQLYEMVLMAALLALFRVLRSRRWQGTLLLWFLLIYGLGRAGIDVFRGDNDLSIALGPITLTQMLCVGAAGIASGLLVARLWKPRTGGPQFEVR